MKQTLLKIALAGLMHDIGKFSQGGMRISKEYRYNNEQLYQPVYNGRYSYQHAIYTAAFIEKFANTLPTVCNNHSWGEGDSFINLAGCHHKAETPMQYCITKADCLSAGLDRADFTDDTYVDYRKYRSTRLLSVLESLTTEEKNHQKFAKDKNYKSNYKLTELNADSIFPTTRQEISNETAIDEYQTLFDRFIKKMADLPHRNTPELWIQHFDSLLAIFCSHIPAARVKSVIPDVSLYDHLRTTASLAVPIYIYHKENNSLNKSAINNNNIEKFLIVSGDFYGIQDFIFSSGGEQQRLRAKLLRGRSFAVSLFSELVADALCKALDLPITAIFLSAAGKFHLLAANTETTKKTIANKAKELNKWLYDISYGQATMGITCSTASSHDFSQQNFSRLWVKHMQKMDRQKYQRIDLEDYGVINDFLNSFNNKLEKPLCPFCGKRPSHIDAQKDFWLDKKGDACQICRDHIMLGANLVKGKNIAVLKGEINSKNKEKLLKPFFNQYQICFYDQDNIPDQDNLIKFYNLGVNNNGSLPTKGTTRLLNGYVPIYTEKNLQSKDLLKILQEEDNTDLQELVNNKVPITFNGIAELAKTNKTGTGALGVMKADIDHLGMFMSCGMSEQRFTISRMSTVSRRIDQFFSIYLPHLLATNEKFNNIYTVFAGGDDLFLIGPWNKMASLASTMRKAWGHYVSDNDNKGGLTFSVGITLHKVHEPMDKMAHSAEEALKQAKDNGRNRITMFNETVNWQTFNELLDKQSVMAEWVDKEYISKVMFYRFNTFIEMAGKEQRICNGKQIVHLRDMDCLKWRALFKYSMERNIKGKKEQKDMAKQEVSLAKTWLENYGSSLKIALWSQLYEQR